MERRQYLCPIKNGVKVRTSCVYITNGKTCCGQSCVCVCVCVCVRLCVCVWLCGNLYWLKGPLTKPPGSASDPSEPILISVTSGHSLGKPCPSSPAPPPTQLSRASCFLPTELSPPPHTLVRLHAEGPAHSTPCLSVCLHTETLEGPQPRLDHSMGQVPPFWVSSPRLVYGVAGVPD